MSRRLVYRTRSPLSGLVKVIDVGAERRLVLDGAVLSTYALDGDWTRARKEYWGEALDMVALPHIPARLFGILMSGQPALAALSGLFILGEVLSAGQVMGMAAIIAASVGATLTIARRVPPPEVLES